MAWNTTAAEADAKIHSIKYDVDLGNISIVRKWTEIDATQLATLSAAKVAETTVTKPKVDNVEYEGTYYCNIIDNDGLPDRSTTIYQRMTKSGAGNELVAVTDIDAAHQETSTYKWHISNAEMVTFKASYATTTAGTRKQFRVNRNNEDGTFDVVGVAILAIAQTLTEYTSTQQSSQTDTEAKILNTTNAALLPIGDVEAGKIKARIVDRKDNDTSDITLRETTVTDQTATSYGANSAGTMESVEHTQAAAAATDPGVTAGTIKRTSNAPTEAGKFNTKEEVTTVTDQTTTSYTDGASEEAAVVLHTQNDDALTDPTAAAGEIKTANNTPTEAGKTKTLAETRKSKDQTTTTTIDGASEGVSRALHTQNESALGAASASAGEIVKNENTPTDFGQTRTEAETRTAKNQAATTYRDGASESSANALNTQADAALAEPSADAGTIVTNTNIPTDFGKTRTNAETRTVKNQTATTYTDAASKSSTNALNTQADAGLAEPSAAAGEIKHSTNTPTDFGKVRTEEETTTVKNQTETSYTDNSAESSASILNTEAAAPLSTPSASAGELKTSTNIPTDSGKTRTIAETKTVKNQTASDYDILASETTQEDLNTQAASALASPTPGDGELKRVVNKPTAAGKVETRAETRTAVDQETVQYDNDGNRYVVITEKTANTAVLTDPGAPAEGTIVRRENTPTAFKNRWKTKSTTMTAQLQQTTETYTDRYGDSYLSQGVNATEAEFDTAVTNASLSSATNNSVYKSVNGYQLIDYTIRKQAVKFSGSGDAWDDFEDAYTMYKYQFTTTAGERKRRKLTVAIRIKQTRDSEDAYDWAATGGNATEAHNGSGVEIIGGRYFRATHITITDWGTWDDDSA